MDAEEPAGRPEGARKCQGTEALKALVAVCQGTEALKALVACQGTTALKAVVAVMEPNEVLMAEKRPSRGAAAALVAEMEPTGGPMAEKVCFLSGAAATAAAAVMGPAGVSEDGPMFVSGPGDVSRPTAAVTEPGREPAEAAAEGQGTCRMVRGGKGRTTSRAVIPPCAIDLGPTRGGGDGGGCPPRVGTPGRGHEGGGAPKEGRGPATPWRLGGSGT